MQRRIIAWAVATVVVAGAGSPLASARSSAAGPAHDALAAAQRLQDDARVLRNGVRTGATIVTLDRLRVRLHGDLERLASDQQRLVGSLPVALRPHVEAHTEVAQAGCQQVREALIELERTLHGERPDRALVSVLGRSIGRHAARTERALRAASRRPTAP